MAAKKRTKPKSRAKNTSASKRSRWTRCIALLLQGYTQKAVAQELKVNESTVSGWRHDPEFKAQYQSALDQVQDDARRRLDSLADKAVETLEALMESEDDKVAVRAAKEVLDRTERFARVEKSVHSGDVTLSHIPSKKLLGMLDQAKKVLEESDGTDDG